MRATTHRDIVRNAEPEICFVCGEEVRQGAEWLGAGAHIWICSACVESQPQALAALIADAIADHPGADSCVGRLQDALKRLECEAWRALAIALEGEAAS
jgi:hypothetical protein